MKKLLFISISIAALSSCKKEPDSPPEHIIKPGSVITIDSLRNWEQANSPDGVSITDSLHVYGIVTMDESEGNIYKNIYIQDQTGAIQVRLTAGSNFAVGDSVRIPLAGAYLSEYSGIIQLDSINPDNVILQSQNNDLTPEPMTISKLDSIFQLDVNAISNEFTMNYEAKLIELQNVQVTFSDLGKTWADAFNQASANIILEDCYGKTILVRSSGFANWAGDNVPTGNGNIVCIVSRYNSDLQLLIRSIDDVHLDGDRCPGILVNKDFEDSDLNSGGWTVVIVTGTTQWEAKYLGGNTFANISNWDGSNNTASEAWYISPAMDMSNTSSSTMSFDNDCNYTGDPLQLLVSTDYTGVGDPNNATWVDISSQVSWDPNTNAWGFHGSGNIDLSAYVGGTVYVAFKYIGTNSSGRTWEVDNIIITG